ncbi:MAG: rhomboid family intramembrane serine protease [Pseudomonadota bacterium]
MFLPLSDGNPVRHVRLQFVTLALIGANIVVYLLVNVAGLVSPQFASLAFGHVPAVANDLRTLPVQFRVVPDDLYVLTAITSTFLHADFWHLLGNMLFLWVFGDNVEDAMGHVRFLVFYLVCGFVASYAHVFTYPQAQGPLIGASGAAAGIVAAYLMLHPKVKVWVLFLGRIPLRLPAWVLLAGWIGYQLFMFFTDTTSNVSWAAHAGGIIAGLVLVGLFKRRGVPLFDQEVVVPEAVELKPDAELPAKVQRGPWGRQ